MKNEVKGNRLISIEEVLIKIKNLYSDHEDFDDMISDLSDDNRIDHWAKQLCGDDFDNNKELSSELFIKAISLAETAENFVEIAKAVSDPDGLNDKSWAAKICAEAELNLKTLRDYNSLIDVLFNINEDNKWAINLAKQAHEKCIEITDDDIEHGFFVAEDGQFEADGKAMLRLAETLFSSDRCADEEGAKDIFEKLKCFDNGYKPIVVLWNALQLNHKLFDDEYSKKYALTIIEKIIDLDLFGDQGYHCDVYLFIRDELNDEDKASEFMSIYEREMICEVLDSSDHYQGIFRKTRQVDLIDFDDYSESRSVLRISQRGIEGILVDLDGYDDLTEAQAELAFTRLMKQVISNLISAVYELFEGNVEERILMGEYGHEGVYEYDAALNMIGNEITQEHAILYFVITKDLPKNTINELLLKLSEAERALNVLFLGGEDQMLFQSYDDGEFDTGCLLYGEEYMEFWVKDSDSDIKAFKTASKMLLEN